MPSLFSPAATVELLQLLEKVKEFPASKRTALEKFLQDAALVDSEEYSQILSRNFDLPISPLLQDAAILSMRQYLKYLNYPHPFLSTAQLRSCQLTREEMESFEQLLRAFNTTNMYCLFLQSIARFLTYWEWLLLTTRFFSRLLFICSLPLILFCDVLIRHIKNKFKQLRNQVFTDLNQLAHLYKNDDLLKKIDAQYHTHFFNKNKKIANRRIEELKHFIFLINPDTREDQIRHASKKLERALLSDNHLAPLIQKSLIEPQWTDGNHACSLHNIISCAFAFRLIHPVMFNSSRSSRLKEKMLAWYRLQLPRVYAIDSAKRQLRAKKRSVQWVFNNLHTFYKKAIPPNVEVQCASIVTMYLGM